MFYVIMVNHIHDDYQSFGWMELKRFTILTDKFKYGTVTVYFEVMRLDRPNKKLASVGFLTGILSGCIEIKISLVILNPTVKKYASTYFFKQLCNNPKQLSMLVSVRIVQTDNILLSPSTSSRYY
jgi:hypothetical protein